jgi:hypothetical protein
MLNRTNLTLSALSNRLNLGTRSLVLGTGVNHGGHTLRLRKSHHDVMRERMVWYVVSSVVPTQYDIPPVPDSIIPGPQQSLVQFAASRVTRRPANDVRVERDAGPDWLLMPLSARRGDSGFTRLIPAAGPCKSVARKQRPGRCARPAGIEGPAHAARRSAGSARAAVAAAAEA